MITAIIIIAVALAVLAVLASSKKKPNVEAPKKGGAPGGNNENVGENQNYKPNE